MWVGEYSVTRGVSPIHLPSGPRRSDALPAARHQNPQGWCHPFPQELLQSLLTTILPPGVVNPPLECSIHALARSLVATLRGHACATRNKGLLPHLRPQLPFSSRERRQH
ncbi:hypothetical protein E2C01_035227 [Portunus trituberculatus]|uniref:Uncharacterized protein n=1 Tax=Portunus trituberculatus TaxID=210409 RepID=A0A5B7F7S6_PORTR|nr:hypothetical protein [Portunus trituberculatus]